MQPFVDVGIVVPYKREFEMKSSPVGTHRCLRSASTAAMFAILAIAPVSAAPRFDGMWNVSLVTEKGACDAGYSYPVVISNGVLRNGGPTPIEIVGKVVDSGAIKVTVVYGDQSAKVSGRLSGAVGNGRWTTGACTGHWTASRA